MKTIIFVTVVVLCLLATAINADKSHKHPGKLVKSGHEDHKRHVSELQLGNKVEKEVEAHKPTNEQTETKPAVAGRKHRNSHHGKNKKGGSNSEARSDRVRKTQQSKPNKHNGQRPHQNNKQHGRKHGRGKQAQ